jgi:hypothetical protein
MCEHCCKKQDNSDDSGSFLFGIIFGLIAAAVIAVIIYRRDKGKTFELLSKKIDEIIKKYTACSNIPIAKTTKKH